MREKIGGETEQKTADHHCGQGSQPFTRMHYRNPRPISTWSMTLERPIYIPVTRVLTERDKVGFKVKTGRDRCRFFRKLCKFHFWWCPQ